MNYQVDDKTLQRAIKGTPNGTGTHFIARCPYCNKDGHLYLQRKTDRTNKYGKNASYYWQCKRCSEQGGLKKLLSKINRLDLIKFGKTVDVLNDSLPKLINTTELEIESPQISLPIGFNYLNHHPYLESRGFTKDQYKLYSAGVVLNDPTYRDYVLFLIFENSILRGYLGRYFGCNDMPRYNNSKGTDFKRLLFGLDEVGLDTHTLFLVEGLMDKKSVDHRLNLSNQLDIKCLATFGKAISEEQIEKIKVTKPQVRNIILMQDPDALKQTKDISFKMESFFNVKIARLYTGDPDEVDDVEFMHACNNLWTPFQFYYSTI